jgi:hypothetical protein
MANTLNTLSKAVCSRIVGNLRRGRVIEAIEHCVRTFRRKDLTGLVVLPYTKQLARTNAHYEEDLSMMTNWTIKKQTAEWQRFAAAYRPACALRPSSSPLNTFGGRLGQETYIDSRHIRH